jgi:hypothetical protein
MELRGSDELGVSSAIGTGGESLHRDPEQVLAEKYDQFLELGIAEILVGVFHLC